MNTFLNDAIFLNDMMEHENLIKVGLDFDRSCSCRQLCQDDLAKI
jgi:hypothetical protein